MMYFLARELYLKPGTTEGTGYPNAVGRVVTQSGSFPNEVGRKSH
jgi:hypothetical protein